MISHDVSAFWAPPRNTLGHFFSGELPAPGILIDRYSMVLRKFPA